MLATPGSERVKLQQAHNEFLFNVFSRVKFMYSTYKAPDTSPF